MGTLELKNPEIMNSVDGQRVEATLTKYKISELEDRSEENIQKCTGTEKNKKYIKYAHGYGIT